MLYIVSILGYGDSLITLSTLSKISGGDLLNCKVVGSDITKSVSESLDIHPCNILSILPDLASFYDLRKKGLARAVFDARHVMSWSKDNVKSGDSVFVENRDWRNRWILGGQHHKLLEVPRMLGAYQDRADVLSTALGQRIEFDMCRPCEATPKQILINPSARHKSRSLKPAVVDAALNAAEAVNANVMLIDVDGTQTQWKQRVHKYCLSPSLREAAELFKSSNLYIGPDSFFLHLAYYYEVPFFGFFNRSNTYFAPPGMLGLANYMYFDELGNPLVVEDRLRRFITPR